MSICRLGKQLGRDYKSVHSETSLLIQTGLIKRTAEDEVRIGWDRVVTELDMAARFAVCTKNFYLISSLLVQRPPYNFGQFHKPSSCAETWLHKRHLPRPVPIYEHTLGYLS